MYILYDPIFGISFTSLINMVAYGLVMIKAIICAVVRNEMPYQYKPSIFHVRIKPTAMKAFFIMKNSASQPTGCE